jgi:hypothetical protein
MAWLSVRIGALFVCTFTHVTDSDKKNLPFKYFFFLSETMKKKLTNMRTKRKNDGSIRLNK